MANPLLWNDVSRRPPQWFRTSDFSRSEINDAGAGRSPGLRINAESRPSRCFASGTFDSLLAAYSCGYSLGLHRLPCTFSSLLTPIGTDTMADGRLIP